MRKAFSLSDDITNTSQELYEQISMASSSLSLQSNWIRTYDAAGFHHLSKSAQNPVWPNNYMGWYQTIYTGSYLLSSSYPLYDLTFGNSAASPYNTLSSTTGSANERLRLYRQFASQLLGNASSTFNIDGTVFNDMFFVCARRALYHDKIRPGATSIKITKGVGLTPLLTLTDTQATGSLLTLYGGNASPLVDGSGNKKGFVFYDAGIIALSSSCFATAYTGWATMVANIVSKSLDTINHSASMFLSSTIYQNTTSLHSTIYNCQMGFNEFNYSSNPTFVDDTGRIIITSAANGNKLRNSEAYVTGVNLYDDNNNLLAVAKLSYPIVKRSDQALNLRVRIDY